MLLVSWAWASTAFLLPPSEAPEAWAPALRLADLTPGTGRPGAELKVDGDTWSLVVYTASGDTVTVPVTRPTTPRAREGIALLAASLLVEAPSPTLPPPVARAPVPPAPPMPRPLPRPTQRLPAPPDSAARPPAPPTAAEPVATPAAVPLAAPAAEPNAAQAAVPIAAQAAVPIAAQAAVPIAAPPVEPIAAQAVEPATGGEAAPEPLASPPPAPHGLPLALEARVGGTLRRGMDGTPCAGADVAWGPLRIGVEGSLPADVADVATLQRWSVELGVGWAPSWVVAPDLAVGLSGALLHLQAADSPDQLGPTLAGWGDVGVRWQPTAGWAVRVGTRFGADSRAASVTTAEGEHIDLGRAWVTPGVGVVLRFR